MKMFNENVPYRLASGQKMWYIFYRKHFWHVLIAYLAFRHLFRVEKCKRKNGGRKMPLRVIYGTLTVL